MRFLPFDKFRHHFPIEGSFSVFKASSTVEDLSFLSSVTLNSVSSESPSLPFFFDYSSRIHNSYPNQVAGNAQGASPTCLPGWLVLFEISSPFPFDFSDTECDRQFLFAWTLVKAFRSGPVISPASFGCSAHPLFSLSRHIGSYF